MALFKSFSRLKKISLCHSYTKQFLGNEALFIRPNKLNYGYRSSQISIVRGFKWHIKNVKLKQPQELEKKLENTPNGSLYTLLFKPFLFTISFSGASLAATAIWQYENARKKVVLLLTKNWFSDKLFTYGKKKYTWRQELNKFWNHLTEGEKLFIPICLMNLLVFMAWRVKRFHPTLIKYFCSTPYGEVVCWPMILSAFSHYSLIHLAANMYVLYSFSTTAVEDLGKEQSLGLYLIGGVVSSFTSYLYKVIRCQHNISVGASGAIMAMLAYICVKYPDFKLSIILLPWIVFSAGSGIKFIMGLDLLGALRGWTYFDHAAHLGGSLSGIAWCYWGNAYIWQKREPLLEWWQELRTTK